MSLKHLSSRVFQHFARIHEGIKLDLSGTNLIVASLEQADLSRLILKGTNLSEANLSDRNGQFQSGEGSKQHSKVQLANGTTGWFTNSCGATCIALLQWSYQDVLYEITIKNGQVEDLAQIANSTILGGGR